MTSKVNMAALGKEIGVDLTGYRLINKDKKNGMVEFRLDYTNEDTFVQGRPNPSFIYNESYYLKFNGAVLYTNACFRLKKGSSAFTSARCPASIYKRPKPINSVRARIVLAALGERIHPNFARKYAKEIEAMRAKLFKPRKSARQVKPVTKPRPKTQPKLRELPSKSKKGP